MPPKRIDGRIRGYMNINRRSSAQVVIGKENYFLSAEGLLMPAKKDQAPPDLRYFKRK